MKTMEFVCDLFDPDDFEVSDFIAGVICAGLLYFSVAINWWVVVVAIITSLFGGGFTDLMFKEKKDEDINDKANGFFYIIFSSAIIFSLLSFLGLVLGKAILLISGERINADMVMASLTGIFLLIISIRKVSRKIKR